MSLSRVLVIEWLRLIMRRKLFLRSLLILTNLIVIIGDFIDIECLTHAFSSRHTTLIVWHWSGSNMETRWLHRGIDASLCPLYHNFFLKRYFAWVLGIVAVKFMFLMHVSWFFGHVLRIRWRSHIRFAIVAHMSISCHGWGFGRDSVTREWRLGRVNLLLLVSHLITMGVLYLLKVCLVLFTLFQHSFIFQWISHVLRLKLDLIKFLTIWRTLITILLRTWLNRD